MRRRDVRFWHKADIPVRSVDVRFWGLSGHSGGRSGQGGLAHPNKRLS
jgi:hypothetical protein